MEWEVWAFVSPSLRQNLSILLRILFLSSVNAKLYIRDKTIELGDATKLEDIILLKAPLKDSTQAKLQIKQDINHFAQQGVDNHGGSEEDTKSEDKDSDDLESEMEEGSTMSKTDSPDYRDDELEEVFH